MDGLTGTSILIAGSSRGIGAATAALAAERGAEVILHGRTNSAALRALSEALQARYIVADGRDGSAVSSAVQQLREDGVRIDGLICTLGAVAATDPMTPDVAAWEEMIAANLLAPVHFIQAVAPLMLAGHGGRIVTVSSIRGHSHLASPATMAYGAAKAALQNATAAYAKHLAPRVLVNCVSPGFCETDMASTWTEEVHREVDEGLLSRAASPAEIAEALLFLVSPGNTFITGQTLLVDGGLELRGGR